MIDVFSFPPGVYVETLNLIASIPGLSILTFHDNKYLTKTYDGKKYSSPKQQDPEFS